MIGRDFLYILLGSFLAWTMDDFLVRGKPIAAVVELIFVTVLALWIFLCTPHKNANTTT